jgi:NADPH-dependent curcumin reductase CurA
MTIDMRLGSAAGNAVVTIVGPTAVRPTEAETVVMAIAKGCTGQMAGSIAELKVYSMLVIYVIG